MKGYKVFNSDWTCLKKQYSCPGVFEQEGKLELCKNGIHFCKKLIDCFKYYDFNPKNKVAEIEAIGEIIIDKNEKKYCTSKIKIIRELDWYEILDLVNTGEDNTGLGNSGDYNSGNYNTGDYNSGNYNTGYYNSGNFNTGDGNTGDCNSSYCNTGSFNTGHHNFGDYNSGSYNFGCRNSGDYNFGHYNSGNYNAGHYNIGDYNTGHYNVGNYNNSNGNFGCFNTEKNKMIFFNKPSEWTYIDWKTSDARKILDKMEPKYLSWIAIHNMTEEEKNKHLKYKTVKGFLKYRKKEELYSLRQKWWDGLSKKEKESVLNLPNFDANIFKEIAGIDVTIEK